MRDSHSLGRRWTPWIGGLLGLVCLFLVTRGVDWSDLAVVLEGASPGLLLLALTFFLVNLALRAFRWWLLLRHIAAPHLVDTFGHLNIGYLANNVLPLRAGELVRAGLFARKMGIRVTPVVATVVVERLFDTLTLVALLMVVPFSTLLPDVVAHAVIALGISAAAVAVGLWLLGRTGQRPWMSVWMPAAVRGRARTIGRAFLEGTAAIQSPRAVVLVVATSVLAWLAVIGAARALMVSIGLDVPMIAALVVVAVVNFGSAVPSTPGHVGVAHFLAVFALRPWNVASEPALGFAILLHALVFLTTSVLGVCFLWHEGLRFRQVLDVDGEAADRRVAPRSHEARSIAVDSRGLRGSRNDS